MLAMVFPLTHAVRIGSPHKFSQRDTREKHKSTKRQNRNGEYILKTLLKSCLTMKKSLPIYSSLHSLSAILALPAVPGSLHFAVYYRAFADRAINRFVAAGRVPGSRPPTAPRPGRQTPNPRTLIFRFGAARPT